MEAPLTNRILCEGYLTPFFEALYTLHKQTNSSLINYNFTPNVFMSYITPFEKDGASHVISAATRNSNTVKAISISHGSDIPPITTQGYYSLEEYIAIAEHEFLHIYLDHFIRSVRFKEDYPHLFTKGREDITKGYCRAFEHYELEAVHQAINPNLIQGYYTTSAELTVTHTYLTKYERWESMLLSLYASHPHIWDVEEDVVEIEEPKEPLPEVNVLDSIVSTTLVVVMALIICVAVW